jgi:hypothetical protein
MPSPTPTVQSTIEDALPPHSAPKSLSAAPNRAILGDVSPNVKISSQTPAFMSKTLAGSPLKRSFTATIEANEGLTYLKRRKLSGYESLSQSMSSNVNVSRDDEGRSVSNEGSFRPIFHSTQADVVGCLPCRRAIIMLIV